MNKISKIKLLSLLIELNRIDQKLYELTKPHERYPAQREGWFFLGYNNVLNMVYYEFCGKSEQEYYSQFKSCSYDKEKYPVAWYKTQYSKKGDGSIKGPKEYMGFIPDCINEVILSRKLMGSEKLKLLTRMFKDLKKLKETYESSSSTNAGNSMSSN